MKKTITTALFLLVSCFLAAPAARGELLYFMVSAFDWDGPKNFDFAMVGVAQDGVVDWGEGGSQVYLTIQGTADSGSGSSIFLQSDAERYTAGPAWADISDYADPDGDYTFYIETYANGEESPIWGYSEKTAQSYSQLLAAHHIYVDDISTPNVTAWVVPEPTSGMLMLLGLAGLGLRRKRAGARFKV